jgi:hypothetical protein
MCVLFLVFRVVYFSWTWRSYHGYKDNVSPMGLNYLCMSQKIQLETGMCITKWMQKKQRIIPERKGGRCVGLTTLPLPCVDCLEIWEPSPLGTLWACPGLQWDCFTFHVLSINDRKIARRILRLFYKRNLVFPYIISLYSHISYEIVYKSAYADFKSCSYGYLYKILPNIRTTLYEAHTKNETHYRCQ